MHRVKIKFYMLLTAMFVFYGCNTPVEEKKSEKPPVVKQDDVQLNKTAGDINSTEDMKPDVGSNLVNELSPLNADKKKKDTGPYRLEVGDALEISILDEIEMTREVTIIPDGTLTYLLVGEVKAEGKTIKEVRDEVALALSEYYVNPKVSIIVKKLHDEDLLEKDKKFVLMMGALKTPGKYEMDRGDRITDAVAKAGGLLYSSDDLGTRMVANLNASYLSRNGVKLDVDFDKLLRLGDMRFDILVEPNDFLYIGDAETDPIIVLGEVQVPRIIPHNKEVTLVEAISRCGGFTEKGSKSQVVILKKTATDSKVVMIDLEALLLGRGTDKNILLAGGDIVFVPEQGMSEYSRYAGYLNTFADLILKGYNVRDQIQFPRIHRRDQYFY